MLNIDTKISSDYALITMTGNLDGNQAVIASQRISLALYQNREENIKTNLIIDITNLAYISSGGLRILLAFHKKLAESNYKMIICNPTAMVSKLLTDTGMYGVFQVQPSVASAIKTVSG